jgi:formylglycine-generating enzyme required for sulfatase activity
MPSGTGWSGNKGGGSVAGMQAAGLDDPQAIQHAGRDLVSLALIDARNLLLQRLAEDESPAALRLALRAGWYADRWICRHVQRQRGEACDPRAPRLAGIEPRADAWAANAGEPPTPEALRSYLAETLDITLDLLAAMPAQAESDAALYFYRLALLHEDRLGEALAERLHAGAPPARAERAPLWLPAQTWLLGSVDTRRADGLGRGLVPHNQRWAHAVAVPEFEIDAQAVNWARYVEFAEDGGYDRRELWTEPGWAWVQAQGRRAPGQVEQFHGAVLVQRGHGARAALARAAAGQPAVHVSRFEAEAWCRWAGRRLPTEPEWEMAAAAGERRGFVWGDVFEWVAGSARAWPGAGASPPGCLDTPPDGPATLGVLRGASHATRRRRAYPQARRYAPPAQDTMFCGFRSCAL